eukprot:12917566-Prorocentrum_lima.AAC.1
MFVDFAPPFTTFEEDITGLKKNWASNVLSRCTQLDLQFTLDIGWAKPRLIHKMKHDGIMRG